MVTCAPKRPSSIMAVISVAQPGHFIDKHCSWPPGLMPSKEGKEFSEEAAPPYHPGILHEYQKKGVTEFAIRKRLILKGQNSAQMHAIAKEYASVPSEKS